MKKVLLLTAVCCTLATNAQNYLVSFTGTGASASVTTVKVENLTKKTSLSLNGTDVLRLTLSTGIYPIGNDKASELKIYPNPMTGNALMEINPPASGDALISILDLSGRQIFQTKCFLDRSRQEFRLSGLRNGIYLITVAGNGYKITGKLLCTGKSGGKVNIENISSNTRLPVSRKSGEDIKAELATVDMPYSNGDWLKFTGTTGIYSTVVTDRPVSDKTITFNFMPCTDGDGNNYPVVEIGSQTWMAENLRTIRYNNSTEIPYVTDNSAWYNLTSPAYCWYENNEASNKNTYGALYNWYAVNRGNLCPSGWHIPTFDEWTTLTTWLGGDGVAGGKLKETGTAHWNPNNNATNETGYTALPGGQRGNGGYFWDMGYYGGYYWSATEGWHRTIYGGSADITNNVSPVSYGLSVRCLKGEPGPVGLAEVITMPTSGVTTTEASSGGTVKSDAGASITARGICWSTLVNPTTDDDTTLNGTGAGPFTAKMKGLLPDTVYYLRAYAVNEAGTAYGNQVILRTMIDTVRDIDGNDYYTVRIGTQEWMAENLKVTRYRNGDQIPDVTDDNSWSNLTTGARCTNIYIDNYSSIYGLLYNWYAVKDNRSICPAGWHVPSDDEWTALITYLGGGNSAGGKLKEAGTSHWIFPNTDATNESGFTALPDGARGPYGFSSALDWGFWWSATEYDATTAWHIILFTYDATVNKPSNSKNNGFSVRCLKDK